MQPQRISLLRGIAKQAGIMLVTWTVRSRRYRRMAEDILAFARTSTSGYTSINEIQEHLGYPNDKYPYSLPVVELALNRLQQDLRIVRYLAMCYEPGPPTCPMVHVYWCAGDRLEYDGARCATSNKQLAEL